MRLSRGWAVATGWAALLGAAGLTSWLLLHSHGVSNAPGIARGKAQRPDYLLHDATVVRFSRNGERRYVIRSDRIAHMPRDDIGLLQRVDLDYFPASGTPWHLRADNGRLVGHGSRLDLDGDVRATETHVADPVRFSAPEATVLLPSERLKSNARVTLRQGHRETRGTGLAADLQTGTLSLLKDVSSRYAPQKPPGNSP